MLFSVSITYADGATASYVITAASSFAAHCTVNADDVVRVVIKPV